MSAFGALIVGIVLLILAYFIPQLPPSVRTVLNILGWILVAVGIILIVFALLGVSTLGQLR
jgi:hypothetical protein